MSEVPVSSAPTVRVDDGIAWIDVDDGKVNALCARLIGQLGDALAEAETAQAVAVLRGRPGIFSAGFDLKTFDRGPEAGREMVLAGARLVLRLLSLPSPVVTWCTGHAYPAGAFLMLAADARFGVAGPWRIGMNETAIGLTVPEFAIELARHRLTPPGFARITTAAMFDPEEARRLGYLDYVVEEAEIEARVRAEATRLRALDRKAYAATKARINEQAIAAIERAMEAEGRA